MKKFFLAVATAILSVSAVSAQETLWGITGGLNVSSLNGAFYSSKAGFNVGAKAEYEIAAPFFVEGSFLLSGKGFKHETEKFNLKEDLWYIHVPVNFGYKFDINETFAVAPKAGVFVDLGLWGSDDNDNNPFSDYDKEEKNAVAVLQRDPNASNFNRFDFGFGLGVNFWAAKHFEVSTGYEFGMVKAYKKDSNSRNWYLNIGFLF
ncbi:MAG: porin family protein [Paludibacteraceae bacterium]|nr:porin family protein [Paludibacteraceae bacterium]